jgi:hypothetical protein
MRTKTSFLGGLLILIGLSIGGWILFGTWLDHHYDRFWPHDLILESPKTEYKVGDTINLVASIVPDKTAKIRVYKDRRKSFALYISGKGDYSGSLLEATENDPIEVIEISPSKPFKLELSGKIRPGNSKEIIFDFGKFGTIRKSNSGQFRASGYWRPIYPEPIDSLEDGTNSIFFRVSPFSQTDS